MPLKSFGSSAKTAGTQSPGRRWALMQMYRIPCEDGKPYLDRLRVVQTPWFGVYVHWVRSVDPAVPHDHPWKFRSVVLRGGYTESRYNITQSYFGRFVDTGPGELLHHARWQWVKLGLNEAHRIIQINKNTVTLVFVGRRCREWGFFPKGQAVQQVDDKVGWVPVEKVQGPWIPWQEFHGR